MSLRVGSRVLDKKYADESCKGTVTKVSEDGNWCWVQWDFTSDTKTFEMRRQSEVELI